MPAAVILKPYSCGYCQKPFTNQYAKKQHKRDKHGNTVQMAIPKAGPSPPAQTQPPSPSKARPTTTSERQSTLTPPPEPAAAKSFVHRGINYSLLSVAQEDFVTEALPSFCHSVPHLNRAGYNRVSFCGAPEPTSTTPKRKAIVIDCEMAGNTSGGNELIQVTMVDFLTGEVLVNSLVNPSTTIRAWRSRIHGISYAMMREANAGGNALQGWEAARSRLWEFADRDTVLIGQALYNDLKALHASHSRIIDTSILAADAVLDKGPQTWRRQWGLKTLCKELLGVDIRVYSKTGAKQPHNCLEDSLATREIALFCILKPDELSSWALSRKVVNLSLKGED